MRQSFASSTQARSSWLGKALQLGLQPFQQGEGVGGGAREAGEHRAAGADAAHLAGVALHHGLAERDLAVAGHRDLPVAADAEDGGAVPADRVVGRLEIGFA